MSVLVCHITHPAIWIFEIFPNKYKEKERKGSGCCGVTSGCRGIPGPTTWHRRPSSLPFVLVPARTTVLAHTTLLFQHGDPVWLTRSAPLTRPSPCTCWALGLPSSSQAQGSSSWVFSYHPTLTIIIHLSQQFVIIHSLSHWTD